MDVDAYLRRIAYSGPRQPCAATLRDLQRQHLFTVPFENLDIALGTPIRLDLPALFDKIVVRRRGGFCYELNALFGELLTTLGFRVQMLSARVRQEDGGFGPEFDHMVLEVQSEDAWLVDVGFGDSFLNPIPFRAGGSDRVNRHRYSLMPIAGDWQLLREDEKGQVPMYVFRDVPHVSDEYQDMCTFHQTSPASHFTRGWICSLATTHGRITLANMQLIVTTSGDRRETALRGEAELRHCLQEAFGVEFDASTPLSKLISN